MPDAPILAPQASTTPEALEALLQLLRRNGVRRFSGVVDDDPMEVEFAPMAPEADSSPALPKGFRLQQVDKSEMCHCGHEFTSHNTGGFCLEACPPAKCAGPEGDKP